MIAFGHFLYSNDGAAELTRDRWRVSMKVCLPAFSSMNYTTPKNGALAYGGISHSAKERCLPALEFKLHVYTIELTLLPVLLVAVPFKD